jgi:hypothetical protein
VEPQARSIPLKTTRNGQELSELCSISSQGEGEHCQLIARIDGIDRDFLFGNGAATGLALGCSPFPSCPGVTQVSRGLALLYTTSTNMCLGFDTAPVSPGASPGTPTPGGQVEIRLLRAPQVSGFLALLGI